MSSTAPQDYATQPFVLSRRGVYDPLADLNLPSTGESHHSGLSRCFTSYDYVSNLPGPVLRGLLTDLINSSSEAKEWLGVVAELPSTLPLAQERNRFIEALLSEAVSAGDAEVARSTWREILRPLFGPELDAADDADLTMIALSVVLVRDNQAWQQAYQSQMESEIRELLKIPRWRDALTETAESITSESPLLAMIAHSKQAALSAGGPPKVEVDVDHPLTSALADTTTAVNLPEAFGLPCSVLSRRAQGEIDGAVRACGNLVRKKAALLSLVTSLHEQVELTSDEWRSMLTSTVGASRALWSVFMMTHSATAENTANPRKRPQVDTALARTAFQGIIPESQLSELLKEGAEKQLFAAAISALPFFERPEEAAKLRNKMVEHIANYGLLKEGRETLVALSASNDFVRAEWARAAIDESAKLKSSIESPVYAKKRPNVNTPEGLFVRVRELCGYFDAGHVYRKNVSPFTKGIRDLGLQGQISATDFVPWGAAVIHSAQKCVSMSESTRVTEQSTVDSLVASLADVIKRGRTSAMTLSEAGEMVEGAHSLNEPYDKIMNDLQIMNPGTIPSKSGIPTALEFIAGALKHGEKIELEPAAEKIESPASACGRSLAIALQDPREQDLALHEQIFDGNPRWQQDFARLAWTLSACEGQAERLRIATAMLCLAEDELELSSLLADPRELGLFVGYEVVRGRFTAGLTTEPLAEIETVAAAWTSTLALISQNKDGTHAAAQSVEPIADALYVQGYDTSLERFSQELRQKDYWQTLERQWSEREASPSNEQKAPAWSLIRVVAEADLPHADTPEGICLRIERALLSGKDHFQGAIDACEAINYPSLRSKLCKEIPADFLVPRLTELIGRASEEGSQKLVESASNALLSLALYSRDNTPRTVPSSQVTGDGITLQTFLPRRSYASAGHSPDALSIMISSLRRDFEAAAASDTSPVPLGTGLFTGLCVINAINQTDFTNQLSHRENLPMDTVWTLLMLAHFQPVSSDPEAVTPPFNGILRLLKQEPTYRQAFLRLFAPSASVVRSSALEVICADHGFPAETAADLSRTTAIQLLNGVADLKLAQSIGPECKALLDAVTLNPQVVNALAELSISGTSLQRKFAEYNLFFWGPEILPITEAPTALTDQAVEIVLRGSLRDKTEVVRPPLYPPRPRSADSIFLTSLDREGLRLIYAVATLKFPLVRDLSEARLDLHTEGELERAIAGIRAVRSRMAKSTRKELAHATRVNWLAENGIPEFLAYLSVDCYHHLRLLPPEKISDQARSSAMADLRAILVTAEHCGSELYFNDGAFSRVPPISLSPLEMKTAPFKFRSAIDSLFISASNPTCPGMELTATHLVAEVTDKLASDNAITVRDEDAQRMLVNYLLLTAFPIQDGDRQKLARIAFRICAGSETRRAMLCSILTPSGPNNDLLSVRVSELRRRWHSATAQPVGNDENLKYLGDLGPALEAAVPLEPLHAVLQHVAAMRTGEHKTSDILHGMAKTIFSMPRNFEVLSFFSRNGESEERTYARQLMTEILAASPELFPQSSPVTVRTVVEWEKAQRAAIRPAAKDPVPSSVVAWDQLELEAALRALDQESAEIAERMARAAAPQTPAGQ